jgi:hypothetical protein
VAHVERSQEIGYREETELLARLTPLVRPLARFTQTS